MSPPGFAPLSEAVTRQIARNRRAISALTRRLWGDPLQRPTYRTCTHLFLRSLGAVYLIAFLSLWVQIHGLIGSWGILPLPDTLAQVERHLGSSAIWNFPTLFWIDSSDPFIHAICGGGALLAVAAICFPSVAPLWLLLFSAYLSLVTAGLDFLSFQWDILLLETGFLALFAAPWNRRLWARPPPPSRTVSFLYRWLLFRLMFASGAVKLTSGDATWTDLTALTYHYFTQPIPNPIAYDVHHLPAVVHTLSTAAMFAIELAVPFLIFGPRRARLLAAAAFLTFQALIALTGNYAYFNLLTALLCLWLIHDDAWPRRFRENPHPPPSLPRPWTRPLQILLVALILLFSALHFSRSTFKLETAWSAPITDLYGAVAPFHIVNTYGLFQVMTTDRAEIVVEGSQDGKTWKAYAFHYKPGDPKRRPPFVAPHQPRLDWQMWFAALGNPRQHRWFLMFCVRLLDGSPPVLDLLSHNPFPDRPPSYLRARLYDYRFTTPQERREQGAWWKRKLTRTYLPTIKR